MMWISYFRFTTMAIQAVDVGTGDILWLTILEDNIDTKFHCMSWDSDSLITAYRNTHNWLDMLLDIVIFSEADGSVE